jgi:alpha-L-rhamnosidase
MNEVYPNDDGAQNYPTFSAIYPEWVWRYYLSTGDDATVTQLLPNLSRLSDYFARIIDPSTGLISRQPLSTNGENYYHYDYATNADTTLNILAVNAFNRIADIATLAVGGRTASIHSRRAAALTHAVNTHLVRSDELYVDGLRADGSQSPHASQLANVTALAYGVVPRARIAAVAKYVASQDISVAPDHGMELLRALHMGGRDADIVRILTDASFPGWAAILKAGGTYTWESWTPSDLIGDSMSHGWGSSALVAMQEVILGAVPSAPTADGPPTMLTIAAPTAGLAHASGAFPTPAGPCSVAWQNTTAGTTLAITIPPNAAARCQFPGATIARLSEGGVPIARAAGVSVAATAGDTVIVDVGAGSYDFTVAPR